mgnify:CR=1 FL=1
MVYLVIANIIIVIVMLILFFIASSIFRKVADGKGSMEVEGKKAKKYMITSVILVPISLLLTLYMIFTILK